MALRSRGELPKPRLVADIGGTNARFALTGADGRPGAGEKLRVADYPGPVEAARAFLAGREVEDAVFAVALPVAGDRVTFTNSPWTFSIREVREALGLQRLAVINDFMAQALAVPVLAPEERLELCPGEAVPGEPIGVIGPGTGLGVALLVSDRSAWRAIASEGGHVSFAPFDERDVEVWRILRRHFGHVSNERVLAAPGLVNLAQALAELAGAKLELSEPSEVTARAAAGSCPFCVEALQRFSLLLGFAAGDLALTLCARGGVYIGGGLCKRLGPLLDAARLRQGFTAKGRFEAYLARIPVYLTVRKDPGLLGAAVFQLDGAPRLDRDDRPEGLASPSGFATKEQRRR